MGVGKPPGLLPSLPALTLLPAAPPAPAAFLKGLSDKQREEHYFCQDFIRLKKIPTWKDTAKGRPAGEALRATGPAASSDPLSGELYRRGQEERQQRLLSTCCVQGTLRASPRLIINTA